MKELEININQRMENVSKTLEKKVDMVDINAQHMLSNQYNMVETVQQRIKKFEKYYKQTVALQINHEDENEGKGQF